MSEPKIRLTQISPSATGTDSISGNVTITNDLTVGGNLTVSGDTTTLNVQTLLVEDNEIILNSNVTGSPSLNASVTVNRGSSSNAFLLWNEGTDKWGWSDDGNTVTEFATAVLKTGDTMTGQLIINPSTGGSNVIRVGVASQEQFYIEAGIASITNSALIVKQDNGYNYLTLRANNVGIGTSSPGSTLHVYGNTQIFSGSNGNTPPLIFGHETGAPKKAIFLENYWMIYQGHDNEGHKFRSVSAAGAATDDMVITGAGNVGIGTTDPQAKLHVRPSNSDVAATALFLEQYNAAGNDRAVLAVQVDAANNHTLFNSSGTNTGSYKFQCGNVERLRLEGSGSLFGNLDSHPEHEFFRAYAGELTSTNLNSLTDKRSGLYYSNANYATNSNLPKSNFFTLLNLRNPSGGITAAGNSADRAAQIFLGDTPNSMFVRYHQGVSGWHPWEQILTDRTAGTVIQAVGVTSSNTVTISSTTFTATSIFVKITPRSTSSKILVFGALHVYKSSGIHVTAKIYRNGTDLVGGLGLGGSDNDGGAAHYDIPNFVLDSPGTTSEITYEFYAAGREAGSFNVNDGGSYRSQIIALEIVG